MPDARRFLTIPQVAEELATSDAQIIALVRRGDLPAIKLGGRGQWRIERALLEQFIQRAYADTLEEIRARHDAGDDAVDMEELEVESERRCECGSCDGDHDAWQTAMNDQVSREASEQRNAGREVVCPTCGVAAGRACRSTSGQRTDMHSPRVAAGLRARAELRAIGRSG